MFRFSGFRDGHCHPLFAAREGAGPNVSGCQSVSEMVELLANYLAANPDCAWVDCGSYSPNLTPLSIGRGSAVGVRFQLDLASATVPIVIHADDHHSIWVNSAALLKAGFGEVAPSLENAKFEVDSNGMPTGVIHEWDAMNLIYQHQPSPSLESDLAALDRAQNRLLASGVVAVQDAWIDRGMETPYLAAAKRDLLRIRVNLAIRIDPKQWQADLQYAKQVRSECRAAALGTGRDLLTANTVKIFIDGVFSSETAFVNDDYCPGGRGTPLWDKQELSALAIAADLAGFQLHFHVVGDAAVSMALDTIEEVDLTNGPADRRPVLAHADLIPHSEYRRLRGLGAVVCVQPAWAVESESVQELAKTLGEARTRSLYPIRRLLDERIPVSFGSDWPVSPPESHLAIIGAQYRQTPDMTAMPYQIEQATTRTEALRAYSTTVAYQLGQEVTMHEDQVEFDTDLATCTPAELRIATVTRVTVAGRLVWPL